jgi:hypothetical protein
MFGYPFKTIFLKSNLNRNQIQSALEFHTFLSDANYKNTDKNIKSFYGEISSQDFKLETIIKKKPLVNFINGDIKGIDNEIYIIARLGSLEHQRIYALFIAVFGVCTAFLIEAFYKSSNYYAPNFFNDPMKTTMLLIEAILFLIIYNKYRSFKKNFQATKAFLAEIWSAKEITKEDIPLVFRLQ